MITTGAAPAAAVMIENIKNNPGQAAKQAGLAVAISKLPPSISGFVLAGMKGKTTMQQMAQTQYYSNIKNAVSAQNHWNQMAEDGNGTE